MNSIYRILRTLALFFAIGLVGCGQKSAQKPVLPQIATASLLAEVKAKTGVEFPSGATTLVRYELDNPESRSDVTLWFFQMEGTNAAKYPRQMDKPLYVGSAAISQAEFLERVGRISIKNPTACYFDIWEFNGLQIQATLVTTETNGSFVMIERFNENVQGGKSPATNN
jgi:hypothetical protein